MTKKKTLSDILSEMKVDSSIMKDVWSFEGSVNTFIQESAKRFAVRLQGEENEFYSRLEKKMEEFASYVQSLTPEKGDKGDSIVGLQGIQGIQGEHGLAGKNGRDGAQGPAGLSGKDGSPDTATQVRDKLSSLRGEARLDASAIKGLPEEMKPVFGGFRGGINLVWMETPTGAVNGSNTTFTLANVPKTNSLLFMVNGQVLTPGGEDYTISNAIVTLNTAPPSTSVVRVTYERS